MNALKKMAAERGAYIAVVTLFLIGATVLSTILHKDSDYAAGLTKPDENIPSTEAESAPSISEPDFSYERFAMTFTGLINAGSMLGSSSYGTLGGLYDEKGGGYFLEDITDITKKDDMTLSFLSSVFSDSEELSARDKSGESEIGWYKAPAKNADILSLGGIDAVSLECPGTKDYGSDGYSDTKAALDECGIRWGDSGKAIYSFHSSGVSVGVYPCTYKADNVPGIISWIENASSSRDFVAVMISTSGKVTDEMTSDFHSFIDAGADLVVATNSRSIVSTESYGDGYIAYSLGSLVNGADKYGEKYSSILEAELIINGGAVERVNYSITPVLNYSDSESWHPSPAENS